MNPTALRSGSSALALVAVLGLSACAIGPVAPADPVHETSAMADGVNSSFSKDGVEEITRSGAAQIDLRSGSMTAQQLGVSDAKDLWDVSVPLSDPVAFTVLGPDGKLEAETSTIRVRADSDGTVRAVAYFVVFSRIDDLVQRVREDAELVGIDPSDVQSFVTEVSRDGEAQLSLNDGDDLGFQVSITITVDRAESGQVLQYTIIPASQIDG
ncbi:hypothetical protein [Microbacterium sp. NPDC057944]|uniref:hypothetical protein n=1 Tax=Microbacterium sp. NPDC057944 TaxID=3346286 RepID=UPI0036DB3692